MGPSSIRLSITPDGGEGTYSFICPKCQEDVEKQADSKIVALLQSAGVSVAAGPVSMPAQASTALLQEAPAIGLDDIIEFHYQLQDEDAVRRFLEEG